MGKAYVTHGAKARCTSGTMSNYINTKNGHGVVYKGQPLLNANDHIPGVNIIDFGNCANMQGSKCVPATPLAWQFCNTKHLIDGAPALTTDSKCVCLLGGMISIEPEGGAGSGGTGSTSSGGGAGNDGAEGGESGENSQNTETKDAGAQESSGVQEAAVESADPDGGDTITVWEFFLPVEFVRVTRKKKVGKTKKDGKTEEVQQKKPDEKLYRHTEEKVGQIKTTKPEFAPAVKKFKEVFQRQKKRYKKIGDICGMPPELIAVIHYRENTSDYLKETFGIYVHNGQKLGRKTTIHPAGLLFHDFDKAAEHAFSERKWLLKKYYLTADSKDIVAMMCFAETYNGLGYFRGGKISPYLYSGTNVYTSGKYIRDHVYDENAVDKQVGVYLLLNSILGSGSQETGEKTEKNGENQEKPGGVRGKKKIIKK